MIFEKEYCLTSDKGEAFADNATLLEIFTSVSKAHTVSAGEQLPPSVAWVVLDWKLKTEKRPIMGKTYRARTWVTEWNRAFSVRCYDLWDEEGNRCATALSRWALVDLTTRRLYRITDDIFAVYEKEKGVNEMESVPFLKMNPKDLTILKTLTLHITPDMFDGNRHVHNTVYSILSEEILPDGVNKDQIDINYRKEIGSVNRVTLEYCPLGNMHIVLIREEGETTPNAVVVYGL